MDWWQIGLITLGFITAGIAAGVLATYLFRRFAKKSEAIPSVRASKEVELAAREIAKREAKEFKEMARREAEEAKRAKKAEARAKKEAELAAREITQRETGEAEEMARQEAEETEKAREAEPVAREIAQRETEETEETTRQEAEEVEVVEEQLKFTTDGLLAEVKNNHRIATEPLTDKLLPFQTDVWGTHQYEVNKLPANLRDELEQVYTDIRLANSIVWMSTEFNRRSQSLDEHYQQLCTSIAERLNKVKTAIEQLVNK